MRVMSAREIFSCPNAGRYEARHGVDARTDFQCLVEQGIFRADKLFIPCKAKPERNDLVQASSP